FMEGVVAGCAIVTYADGKALPEEKQKMIQFMRSSQAMQHFDLGEIQKVYTDYCAKLETDFTFGEAEMLQIINRVKGKDAEARTLVRVCCAIGAADGSFDADEQKAVRKICRELALDPADFDL
ncbi:MAG: tellurite resistance TerB family protein, partial [Pseudomonadota bacterium]|nr:tellurite resistance TerB family protein [Pseudomonadota bacterium]